MKIAFYFDDSGFEGLDLSNPLAGNNGVGGTQYCFLLLAQVLYKYKNTPVTFYHYHKNKLPEGVKDIIIQDIKQMMDSVGDSILIYKCENQSKILKNIQDENVKLVAWAHNYILGEEANELSNNPFVKRVVFVGKEQYDRYIDHPIIKKANFIYNMFFSKQFSIRPCPKIPIVTYTGSLVESKGFHILASVWKDVLHEVPNAQLYVLGTGKLYNRKAKLGSLNLTEQKYEDRFYKYITENGEILPSIHFCGNLGIEKSTIYSKTSVGIINPSGRTETFGISAVEMEACGIPVISKASNGLYDTIINKETGYLIKTKYGLKKRIIKLLRNSELNESLGNNAKKFVDNNFDPVNLVNVWYETLLAVEEGVYPKRYEVKKIFRNYKWLRLINANFHRIGIRTKSIIEYESMAKNFIRKIRS